MELSVRLYLSLLFAVAIGRLIELRHSRKNQQQLQLHGSQQSREPGYKWMVALHCGVLASSALEVVFANRPWIPALGFTALAGFVAANAARWWVIRTLGPRWNVQVMSTSQLGVVTGGPYRWVRHPNYTAVFMEMLALPLIHTAWLTALIGSSLHIWVLRRRIALEETVLARDPAWSEAFAAKPRFLP